MPQRAANRPRDVRDSDALRDRVSRMIQVAKSAGLTQEDIAEKVGTNQGGVSAWELKKVEPTSFYLMRLIETCSRSGAQFDANWVLMGKGEEFVTPVRETPDESYVRVGLTILARVEDATAGIRRDILKAEGRLRVRPSDRPGARSMDVADEVEGTDRLRPLAAPRPLKRRKRPGS